MAGSSSGEADARSGDLSRLLATAREGADGDLGRLLDATRRYLLLVASHALDQRLHPKFAPSDLVQETFIDAHRKFDRFEGNSEAELLAWLRRILLSKAADVGRRFRGTTKRNIDRELPIDDGRSNAGLQLAGSDPSPSTLVVLSENGETLAAALHRLPDDYRKVIELRSLLRLPFADVARQMGRSEDASGKLWFRALQRLRDELASSDESGFFQVR